MNGTFIAASLVLAATVGTACSIEDMIGSRDYEPGGDSRPAHTTTFEAEWVGVHEGTGRAELLDAGETYHDVPVRLETWTTGAGLPRGRLHGVLRIQLFPPPDVLVHIAEVIGPGEVAWTAGGRIEDTTSPSWLLLGGPDGYSTGDGRRHVLQLERSGNELVGLLTVFRSHTIEVATLSFRASRVE